MVTGRHIYGAVFLVTLCLLLMPLPFTTVWRASAQQGNYAQFLIEQDNLQGAPDFGFLNHPLGPADRTFVKQGHFYRVGNDLQPNTSDDERVRFFGANLAFSANMPYEPSFALRLARRLRKLGINLVRLHLVDDLANHLTSNLGSILTAGPFPTFDTRPNIGELTRLRELIAKLKAEGIYVDLNLHVAYTFRPGTDPLIPAVPGCESMPGASKPLHLFYPPMIALQQQYAGTLLDLLQLNQDPVLAMVEINNESSLLEAWQNQEPWQVQLDRYLLGDYYLAFQQQWNCFLQDKYGTSAALRTSWGAPAAAGPELLPTPMAGTTGGWVTEIHPPFNGETPLVESLEGVPTLKARVQGPAQSGNAQAIYYLPNLMMTRNQPYTAELEIRAELNEGQCSSIDWTIQQVGGDYQPVVWRELRVTNHWQKFTFALVDTTGNNLPARFALLLQRAPGVQFHIRRYSLKAGLVADQQLESGNVGLVNMMDGNVDPLIRQQVLQARTHDYLLFLADRHRAYLNALEQTIRAKVGPLVPVTGTQMDYGGMLNLDSHTEMDYLDAHFYEDYHNIADGNNWFIRNYSTLSPETGLRAFKNIALAREAGKPFTISEFNLPWPNHYGAEIDPLTAAFAAFQDWDAVMHFAYSHGRDLDYQAPNVLHTGVPTGLNLDGDWAKLANLGQAAWLFRTGALAAGNAPLEIPVSQALRLRAGRERVNGRRFENTDWSNFLNRTLSYQPAHALLRPVRLVRSETMQLDPAATQVPSPPYVANNGQMTYAPNRQLFLIHSPKAAGIWGVPGTSAVTAGDLELELLNSVNGYAAIFLTPLDNQNIGSSQRLLLSTPGHVLRSQPNSNPLPFQRLFHFGGGHWSLEPGANTPGWPDNPGGYANTPNGHLFFGLRPTWMERVESFVTIRTAATGLTVYPLNGDGTRLTPLPAAQVQAVAYGFRLHLQATGQPVTPWYEIVATCAPVTINPATIAMGTVGIGYQQNFTQTGGSGIVTFSLIGALPAGLTFDAVNARLIGTPTQSGNFPLTIKATAANGCLGTASYTLVINCQSITVGPATPANGFIHLPYSHTFTQMGGTAPVAWSLSGTLPNGLALNPASGTLSGIPTQSGSFPITVRVVDINGCSSTCQFILVISGNGLVFYPLPQPVRLLETRTGFSGCITPGTQINAGGTFTLPARGGCSGVPANAQAVTGNITVIPQGAGFLTLFPSSTGQPTVANSNFTNGEVTNNVFTVGLGAGDGAFKIFSSATTEVIVDVTGYYAPPGTGGLYFHPLPSPVRLLETRVGQTGCIAPGAALIGTENPSADPNLDLPVQGRSPVASPCNLIPASAQVLVGNATSVMPSGGGYLTIYPSGGTRPTMASSNYAGSDVINGPFAVKLGTDGKFKIYTFATTHLVVDILGYFSQDATDANGVGLLFTPLPAPVRLLETRPDFPGFPLTGCTRTNAKIPGNVAVATHTQPAAGFCGLPVSAQAVVGNVSVVNSTNTGFLTLFPGNLTNAPLVATSNYPAPATFGYNRHYFVGLSPANGTFKALTQFTTDLILDASGYFAP